METIRSEAVKLTTTRTPFALIAGAAIVVAIAALSTSAGVDVTALEVALRAHPMYPLAAVNLGAFALIAGMKVVTDEYRHGSIVPTFLSNPQRGSVLASKVAVGAAYGAVLTAIATGVMLATAYGIARARGASPAWQTGDVLGVAGLIAAGALWAVLGVGIGSIVRHQVAAIVGGVIWILAIENLASVVIGNASRLLPGQAAWALADAAISIQALRPLAGGGLMLAYAVLVVALALKVLGSRDIEPV